MNLEDISPDQVVYWRWGFFELNATIVFTWAVMLLMALFSIIVTSRLSTSEKMSRWQNLLEILVSGIRDQISNISHQKPDLYLPYIGTLFLFIAVSNLLMIVPGFESPTASLSTTAALALTVFVAVIGFGVARHGPLGYIKQYLRPTPLMLPFNIIGELSRTLALAVRLFGNIMSGVKIGAILLAVVPFFFPVIMSVLGLLTGMIQAYIFAVLAMVYIASATRRDTGEEAQSASEPQAPQGEQHG